MHDLLEIGMYQNFSANSVSVANRPNHLSANLVAQLAAAPTTSTCLLPAGAILGFFVW
jgi:hypothetical protein